MSPEKRLKIQREHFGVKINPSEFLVALAGNPNVGKSTVFNALTGLRQHTGNWPGKTVDSAQGRFTYKNGAFLLVDLPGTYSILAHTPEEIIARDFICFGLPDATLVVLDATCLERNLNLALQIMEITSKVVVCVNLMDEARKKQIYIDILALEKELGVPVVAAAARYGEGLPDIREALYQIVTNKLIPSPRQVLYSAEVEKAIQHLLPDLNHLVEHSLNPRWVALRLLDADNSFLENINSYISMTFDGLQEVAPKP